MCSCLLKNYKFSNYDHNFISFFDKYRSDNFSSIDPAVPCTVEGKLFTALGASKLCEFPRSAPYSILYFYCCKPSLLRVA